MDVEQLVAEVRADPGRRDELLPLLHEGHQVYDGRGESAALRTRGWVMAAYETVGLPPDAEPAVLETLRTGLDPFAVAAAARAARGAVAPGPGLADALLAAMDRPDLDVEHGPERAVNGVTRRLASVEAAREELGFKAEIGLEDGLRRLVDWWRAERIAASALAA